MQIITSARRIPLTRALRSFVQANILGTFEKFAHAVASISVELRDKNGRRGGGDKRCRIKVALVTGMPVMVEEEQANLRRAIRHAADRAAAQVHALIKR